MSRAREASAREGAPLPEALARVYEQTRERVEKRLAVTTACTVSAAAPAAGLHRFLCDASLGGLARWLRAAGYEADWRADASPDDLAARAALFSAVLVTTDSDVLGRRDVRDGAIEVVWVPSCLRPGAQLSMVLRDLGLALREPRCMTCGGELQAVPKADVLERIPPRTRAWKDEYFTCARCGGLFWQGTHWERIVIELRSAASRPPDPPHASPE